jgi:ribose/xylose/arabinose/galactoside ABC-type transport system permease subunit/ABC-type multidrug transport system ATPase subunit
MTDRLTRLTQRPEVGALMGAIAIFVIFAGFDATPSHLWLTQTGIAAWSQQAAFIGIMAVPVGLLMIGGEFDLSAGVMTGVTALVMALLVGHLHWNAWLAILGTLVFAALIGLLNGLVVTKSKLPSFIVTLATFFVLRGVSIGGVLQVNSGSTQVSLAGTDFPGLAVARDVFGSTFASSSALPSGYQTAVLWFIAVTAVGAWVLDRTTFGNWIYAVGGDANVARNTGVPVARTKILLFLSTSLAAGLVGIISFTQASSAVSEQGVGYEFYYIIAAVIGGCLLTGGYGSAIGAALGACTIGMAFQGVIYAGWNSSWDFAFLGIVLFLAVLVNTVVYRRSQRARGARSAPAADSQHNAATPPSNGARGSTAVLTGQPLLEVRGVTKYFGSVSALRDISLNVYAGEVTCVLGDNGAGKSTLIKILSGVFPPDAGELLLEGRPVSLADPREARAHGIATVFQDLATLPLMSLWRNFFLGQEPATGRGPLRRLNTSKARTIMREELLKMGIDVRDPGQKAGTLSGGERQALAIARAVYFGARVLILDEPTSALGVRQSGIVLKYLVQARELGKGVIFITHNPHHAAPVGDRFYVLKRGRLMASALKNETTVEGLTAMMAGGAELAELSEELMRLTAGASAPDAEISEMARKLAEEAQDP